MATKLAIPAYLGATVVLAFEIWRYAILGTIISFNAGDSHVLLLLLVPIILLILSIIWLLILAGVYSLVLKFLWSNPPEWLHLPKLKSLIIRDLGILVVSTLPIVLIFLVYVLLRVSTKQIYYDLRTPKLAFDIFLLRFSWLWFICAAYLYQWRLNKPPKQQNPS